MKGFKKLYTFPSNLFFKSELGGLVPNHIENNAFLNSSPETTPL
jgi:hypothetical protein